MILNSFSFLIVLPLVLAVYAVIIYLCRNSRYSNIISAALLTSISYGFFITYQPLGALVLFGITVATYLFALALGRIDGKELGKELLKRRNTLIVCGVVLVLIPLAVMKYAGFIMQSLNDLESRMGVDFIADNTDTLTTIFVPLGISFFTFQSLGYLWDVYRGKISAEHNFLYYTLFVGFFPQIASGPISKADELLPQIKGKRNIKAEDFTEGVRLMLWGYFLKAVVADRLATFVNPVYANYADFSGGTCFVASIFYSLQIYGDFAGYSLIAIGVGRLFGFRLINNFNRPYFSSSLTEFWKRWHISLTRWLRDYVYIPLGGNRKGNTRTYGNILTTFLVSGIWHGANFTFIIWGAIHGIVQCLERFFNISKAPRKWVAVIRIIVTFLIVNFAWIFFRLPSVHDAWQVVVRICTCAPGARMALSNTDMLLLGFALISLVTVEIVQEYFPKVSLLRHSNIVVRCATIVALIVCILTVGVLDSGQFIYVNF